MPKMQFVLYPDTGTPLPRAPIVTPMFDDVISLAKMYVKVLEKELAEEDPHTGQLKWRGQKRQTVMRTLKSWKYKVSGEDAHYMKHGTHRRPMDSCPPGFSEMITERIRNKQKDAGTWVGNQAHRYKYRTDHHKTVIKRLQKKHGTGTVTKNQE